MKDLAERLALAVALKIAPKAARPWIQFGIDAKNEAERIDGELQSIPVSQSRVVSLPQPAQIHFHTRADHELVLDGVRFRKAK